MASHFVIVDRQTPMLLPEDMRAWVPENHIVHFILEAVEEIPESTFHINWRGSGSDQYPPRMMLAVLIYGYVTGRFSSREIQAATYSDVAMRYLSANTHPDHDTLCAFRRQNEKLFKQAFVRVLETAQEMKALKKVGTVSLDGSKILANASKHSAVSYDRAGEMIRQLELEVEELMKKAEEADNRPLEDGLSVPEEIARREDRMKRLRHARKVIEQRAKEKAAEQRPEYERKMAERQVRKLDGKPMKGREPQEPSEAAGGKDQFNFTDSESRIMKAGNGDHFEQCYNAQAAVDADGSMLIVGEHVSDQVNDKKQLVPGVESICSEVKVVEAVLVDSGFYSEKAVDEVERFQEGKAAITVYAAVEKQSHHRTVTDLEKKQEPEPLAENAPVQEKMRHRLKTAAGRQLYRLRKQTVEPVFGIIKEVMGFRRFSMRGKKKASLEWTLVTLAYNIKRLHKSAQSVSAGIPEVALSS